MRTLIKHLLAATEPKDAVTIKGWVRTRRDSKGFSFLELNDGSCLANLQVDRGRRHAGLRQTCRTSPRARRPWSRASWWPSPAPGQKWELRATSIELARHGGRRPTRCRRRGTRWSSCAPSPICVRARICSARCFARAAGWRSPCTSFSRAAISSMSTRRSSRRAIARARARCSASRRSRESRTRNRRPDFFGKPTYLTVSGQLEAETFACALSNVYTFGPTFRAENSNTARHAAEFWMIEPEMAFCDLQGDMDLGEEFIKAMARIRTRSIAPRISRSSPSSWTRACMSGSSSWSSGRSCACPTPRRWRF